ncbi:hypothetical protein N9850_00780 [Granulosicoccus sp.]|nr:hypothetical protein [Granulosicoccus sp.]MDB4222278.1 hypothetical protein [Granulosicoccus sp.]
MRTAFLDAQKLCAGHYDEEHQRVCDRLNNALSGRIASDDLVAQQSMAMSTKGMLKTSADQLAISIVATCFLFLTVLASFLVLFEAKLTTKAANDATEASVRTAVAAESAERAYIIVDVGNGEFCGEVIEDRPWLFRSKVKFPVNVRNYGRTVGRSFWCRIGRSPKPVRYERLSTIDIDWLYTAENTAQIVLFNDSDGTGKPAFWIPNDRRRHGVYYNEFDTIDTRNQSIIIEWGYIDSFNCEWVGNACYSFRYEGDRDELGEAEGEYYEHSPSSFNDYLSSVRGITLDTVSIEIKEKPITGKARGNAI